MSDGVVGTYLHGMLEEPAVCAEVLGVTVEPALSKDANYDKLADWFQENIRHLDSLGIAQ